MVASSTPQLAQATPAHRWRDAALLSVILVAALTAIIFGKSYAARETERESAFWSARLERSAQAGARALGERVELQSAALAELVDNASLRIYLWNLQQNPPAASGNRAERDYLGRLLAAQTDTGTRAQNRAAALQSLALLNPGLDVVAATAATRLTPQLRALAEQARTTRTRQLALLNTGAERAQVVQALPVPPPPGAAGRGALAGVLIAGSDAQDLLQPVLTNLPGYFNNDASLLLSNGGGPFVVLAGAGRLASVDKVVQPGFGVRTGANGATFLQATQRVPGTAWTLVRRVDEAQALQALQQRIWARYLALGLAVFAAGCLLWAWRERGGRLAERAQTLPTVPGQAYGAAPSPENQLLNKLVASLIGMIDLHDPYSAFHSARLAELCRAVGEEMELDQQSLNNLVTAALLANIGKLALPRELLTKRDVLTEPEQTLLQSHVEEGVEILRKLEFDDPVLSAIAQKQESLDGSGYPAGIAADRITLPGRILALSNAYIALISPRAYRDALSEAGALDELRHEVGTAYDPQTFAALERVLASGAGLTDWDSAAA